MKAIFLIITLVLVGASAGIYSSFPDVQSEVPVIYWVTDPNPARDEQVAIFHRWLIKNGHGERVTLSTVEEIEAFQERRWPPPIVAAMREANADGSKLWDVELQPLPAEDLALPVEVTVPLAELRLDSANREVSKKIIQSVSGVAGDVMDMGPLHYFIDLGVMEDVTEEGQELGFSTDETFASIVPDLTKDGRQYGFPCNVYVNMVWVNKSTFARYGLEPPPKRWTIEEFESIGRKFVEAANPPGQPRQHFFINTIDAVTLNRSMGLSMFNETLTRSTLDDDRFVRTLRLMYKWTYEDRILPSLADRQSFDTQAGYGGATLQLFNSGNYAMFTMGRYALIQLRKFGQLDLAVSEPPHAGFPNTRTGTRCASVYVGGKPEIAKFFLAYLASEEYNMQIVRDADALPPNPRYTRTEAFSRPPDYPSEWGLHDVFVEAAEEIAIPNSRTPFAPEAAVSRIMSEASGSVMAGLETPEVAAAKAASRINGQIARTVAENDALRERFDAAVQLQAKIDQYRAEGKKIPLEWISNPFHRHYYVKQGWAE